MAVVIMLVHTYYGFTARGGPAGVGEAVGRAVRTSLIVSPCSWSCSSRWPSTASPATSTWPGSGHGPSGRQRPSPGVVDTRSWWSVIAVVIWLATAMFAGTLEVLCAGDADLGPIRSGRWSPAPRSSCAVCRSAGSPAITGGTEPVELEAGDRPRPDRLHPGQCRGADPGHHGVRREVRRPDLSRRSQPAAAGGRRRC